MSKNWSWNGTGPYYDQKFACSYNPGQNIWNKMKQSSKTGQEKNSLIFFSACFLTAIGKM